MTINIAELLQIAARNHATAPALIEGRTVTTFGELATMVSASIALLQANGLCRGKRLAIVARSGTFQLANLLAAAHLGAAACILDRQLRPGERDTIIAAIDAELIVSDAAIGAGSPGRWLQPSPASSAAAPAALPPMVRDADLPVLLLLTSGSTGLPKVMTLTHGAALCRARVRTAAFDMPPGQSALVTLGLSTTAGIQLALGQLHNGGPTYLFSNLHAAREIVETVRDQEIGHVTIVPTIAHAMLQLPFEAHRMLPDSCSLLVTAAAFHPDDKRAIVERVSARLYESYGASGAGGIAVATPQDVVERPNSVGRPFPGVTIEIVDSLDRPLATGETGRIRVRSPGAATGYFADSGMDRTDELFRAGWVYPGDVGRLDAEGYLYLEGRVSNIIVRGGLNLYPEQIERVLMQHPEIVEAAVLGIPDRALGEVPVALLVPRSPLAVNDLQGWCRAQLSPARIPVAFHSVTSLPRTPAGKLQRTALAGLLPG